MAPKVKVQPSLEEVEKVLANLQSHPKPPNLVPLCATIPADTLTPTLAYLKVSAKSDAKFSFLFESAATTETIGRYSFVGANPRKILKTGPGHGPETDPLTLLEEELSQYREADIPGLNLPPLTGGAVCIFGALNASFVPSLGCKKCLRSRMHKKHCLTVPCLSGNGDTDLEIINRLDMLAMTVSDTLSQRQLGL